MKVLMARRPFYLAIALLLAACDSAPPPAPALGAAYVGPMTLNLREELAARSTVVATVKHGERLEIIQSRRRFIKVRTAQGAEGWTDSRLLLSPEQMEDLRRFNERAAKLPSQGAATVDEILNMHIEPSRQSPSFNQIPEGGSVQVIGQRLMPRHVPAQDLPIARPSRKATAAKKRAKEKPGNRVPPPPMPKPPAPPANWLELSKSAPAPAQLAAIPPVEANGEKPPSAPMDDWYLVRTRDGKSGWVLARMVTMAIPDEVAQYAEGHRITAYLSLGEVKDKSGPRQNWLWATITKSQQPYQFDSFRVFVWSIRHHRYETAYIERNIEGYYPLETHTVTTKSGKISVEVPAFSVIVEDKDGQLVRKTYAFSGYHVRMTNKELYQPPDEPQTSSTSRKLTPDNSQKQDESLWKGLRRTLGSWRRSIFGKR